jgi:mannose-6-phosphate isomerase-like protein (cupin superfamily)
MSPRKTFEVIAATFMVTLAFAQPPAAWKPQILEQPDKTITYFSAADVAALITRAKKERKPNESLVVAKALQLAPYATYLEYRATSKPLANVGVHPKEAELVYVLQGSGTFVTGGSPAADDMSITGGESQKIGKGDFIFIPEGTPHWINHIDRTLVLMSIHVPRPMPAQ